MRDTRRKLSNLWSRSAIRPDRRPEGSLFFYIVIVGTLLIILKALDVI